MSAPRVSAVIPTLNGAASLPPLLAALERERSLVPLEIVAIDSGSTDGTTELLARAGARVLDLGGKRFGHGTARNRAAAAAKGEVLLWLTQDVEPAGEGFLAPLLEALEQPGVAGAFGRQVPRGASPEEAFLAAINYGERPRAITREALGRPFGPGATLFSNAFGAMKKSAWERFPFPDIVMSEDQAWGRAVLAAGMIIRYVPESAVYHGHRWSLPRAFGRNFQSGRSLEELGLARASWRTGLSHLSSELSWIRRNHGAGAAIRALGYESVRMVAFQCGRMRQMATNISPRARAEAAYTQGREALIREAIARALSGATWLSAPGYGRGFDERVVEYPWTYARLMGVRRLLDVGSTLNSAEHLARLGERGTRVLFLNPYRDEGFRGNAGAARYLRADARAPALKAGSFECVTCLSTLEHLGCDNSRYGGPPRVDAAEPARARQGAMRELRRLLAPGGRLLLTVPYGRAEDHGWFVQLDEGMLAEALAAFAPTRVDATYFLHADGWRVARAEECASSRYGADTRGSGAVACLELVA